MEPEVIQAELVLPNHLSFKKIQMYEKYPKGQSRGRHWKHLKQIIQAENFQNYPPDESNYVNIESPPSMHPCKKICDITGYEVWLYFQDWLLVISFPATISSVLCLIRDVVVVWVHFNRQICRNLVWIKGCFLFRFLPLLLPSIYVFFFFVGSRVIKGVQKRIDFVFHFHFALPSMEIGEMTKLSPLLMPCQPNL